MASSKTPKKCRNYMYTQQVAHLPNQMTADDLFSHIETKLKPKRFAGILHDHDKKDDNVTPTEDHIHVMLQFANARSIDQVAKEIGDSPQYVEAWNDNVNAGFAYLIHATKNARHKHQYSCDSIRANFDYASLISQLMKNASKAESITTSNKINGLLDMVGAGQMSLKEAKTQLSGSSYAKASAKLERAHELYLERRADELYRSMETNHELVCVHWFYGATETGKTFLAERFAKEAGEYYITTTTKDAFQYYEGEQIIILDELRPDVIPYSELLAMCNPFSRGKVIASSRYYNKPLACRVFYVTSPYDPLSFYNHYKKIDKGIDHGIQLFRRLSSVLRFTDDYICKMEYDRRLGMYRCVAKKENPYSKKNQALYTLNNIFDRI